MKRLCSIAVVLCSLAALAPAATIETATSPSLVNAATSIRTELVAHGDRVLGRDAYRWSTRLEKIEGCRAEFSVRITNKVMGPTIHVESVNVSLGGVDPDGIAMQQMHWLQVPCWGQQNCVVSTTTCTRQYKDGVVINCSTPAATVADAFSVELDGNMAAAQRLQQALREAVSACHQPTRVSF
jgi:hypothetical protein